MDSRRDDRTATTPPATDSEELYWGPEYEAPTVYFGPGSRSPQPSEGDLERERELREALQEELLKSSLTQVSVHRLVPCLCCCAFMFIPLPLDLARNFHDTFLVCLHISEPLLFKLIWSGLLPSRL